MYPLTSSRSAIYRISLWTNITNGRIVRELFLLSYKTINGQVSRKKLLYVNDKIYVCHTYEHTTNRRRASEIINNINRPCIDDITIIFGWILIVMGNSLINLRIFTRMYFSMALVSTRC